MNFIVEVRFFLFFFFFYEMIELVMYYQFEQPLFVVNIFYNFHWIQWHNLPFCIIQQFLEIFKSSFVIYIFLFIKRNFLFKSVQFPQKSIFFKKFYMFRRN